MGIFSRGKTSSKGNPNPRISPAAVQRIKNILAIRQLESMPAQAANAFRLASDPKAKPDDFVKVIERDEVLSARVVRVANSVYFFRGTPANDIEKAVANIGLNELRCLISTMMLHSLLQGKHPAREQVWANAVATAIGCRILSRYTSIPEGEAFLCGLLHDVGKLIIIRRSGAEYEKILRLVGSAERSFIEAEEEVLELNHVEVGMWVGEAWNFPPAAVRAIANHHGPWELNPAQCGKGASHALLVKAADTIAHSLGLGHNSSLRRLRERSTEERSRAFEQLGLDESAREAALVEIQRRFDEECALYQAETSR